MGRISPLELRLQRNRHSFKRCASISYNAISQLAKTGEAMQSPSTFRAKTVLPAPKKVIFAILASQICNLSQNATNLFFYFGDGQTKLIHRNCKSLRSTAKRICGFCGESESSALRRRSKNNARCGN